MMKLLFIVLDGMGDRPGKKKTPLAAAATPTMDFLAKQGKTGLVNVIPGIAPESDSAVISILGYNPHKYYTGRGPLEAEGAGVDMKNGMLAIRTNFATSSDGKKLVDRRVARSLKSDEAKKLAAAVNKKVKLKNASFYFESTIAHRAALVIKSKTKLSSAITNTDPAYRVTKKGVPEALAKFPMVLQKCKPLKRGAKRSAELVNEFTEKVFEVLDKHPVNKKRKKQGKLAANLIICRDAGNKVPDLPRRKGKWAILADMPLEVGIGRLAGMSVVTLPLSKSVKKGLDLRFKKTLASIKKFDALYIHIKGPDLFGHDGDFKGKKKSLEDIDKHFLTPLLKKISLKDTIIAITADHCTPCAMKAHSADPVPLVICGKGVKPDKSAGFSEKECKKGKIGRIKGPQIMKILDSLR
ncbi:MAG: 2,3-bisphosphoglycerate-independent phosphoglycerate mutase [bacterium]|nr:2,3-bisphosphoglycerate-independent phosphoglycerate mutase [bacterium]